MRIQDQARPDEVAGLGIAFMAGGIYFILVGINVLPTPEAGAGAPPFIIFGAGLAFVLAGLNCMVRARSGNIRRESVGADRTPRWTRLSHRMFAIGLAGTMSIIGVWIAYGSGPRVFGASGPLAGISPAGEMLGRSVFALAAVIAWIYAIALSIGAVRRLFGDSEIAATQHDSSTPDSKAPTSR